MCAQGCAGRGMKYYNTSLGNCAAPSSGVYQVSNTLIRKPPLPHRVPHQRQERELRDFFPILLTPHVVVRVILPSPMAKISSVRREEKNYRDVCGGKNRWRARRNSSLSLSLSEFC